MNTQVHSSIHGNRFRRCTWIVTLTKSFARHAAQTIVDTVIPMAGARAHRRRAGQIARRNAQVAAPACTILRNNEVMLVQTLARLIVPSDEAGPGADEAGVVGSIDRLLSQSQQRAALYPAGLIAIDEMARRVSGVDFVAMKGHQQQALLSKIESLADTIRDTPTLAAKLRSVTTSVACQLNGSLDAIVLLAALLDDVKEAFYTSQVCWSWLEYDGPPMPRGYLAHSNGKMVLKSQGGGTSQ